MNKNRDAGLGWEREVVRELRKAGYPNASSTRAANRKRDAEGIDACNADESIYGRMEDDVQCKATQSINWQLLVDLEKADKNKRKRRKILLVKLGKTVRNRKNHIGKFALMFARDYFQLLTVYNAAKILVASENSAELEKQLKIIEHVTGNSTI